jgi:hypothetical protein
LHSNDALIHSTFRYNVKDELDLLVPLAEALSEALAEALVEAPVGQLAYSVEPLQFAQVLPFADLDANYK